MYSELRPKKDFSYLSTASFSLSFVVTLYNLFFFGSGLCLNGLSVWALKFKPHYGQWLVRLLLNLLLPLPRQHIVCRRPLLARLLTLARHNWWNEKRKASEGASLNLVYNRSRVHLQVYLLIYPMMRSSAATDRRPIGECVLFSSLSLPFRACHCLIVVATR